MNILLVSEGKNELLGRDGKGALARLVRRCLDRQDVSFEERDVRDAKARRHPGRGNPFKRKIIGWIAIAASEGFDALVFVIDRDGDPRRQKQGDAAQADTTRLLPRAVGIAVEAFDAWALADETALSRVLEHTVSRQPDPEKQREPKQTCTELLDQSSVTLSRSEFYAAVAEATRLDRLEQRCPEGFGVFAERVRKLGDEAPR
ncbi:MAG: hypothetical protein AAF561_05105 [Planctomycetota bacterium]